MQTRTSNKSKAEREVTSRLKSGEWIWSMGVLWCVHSDRRDLRCEELFGDRQLLITPEIAAVAIAEGRIVRQKRTSLLLEQLQEYIEREHRRRFLVLGQDSILN